HLANNEPSHKNQIEKTNPQKRQERKSEEEVELNDNDFDDEDKTMPPLQIPLPKIQFKIGDYKHFCVKWSRRTLASIGISQLVIHLVKPLDPKTPNTTFKLKQLKIDNRIVSSIEERQLSANTLDIILLPRKWCANTHDGSTNGSIIFDTLPGRSIFARRNEIEKFNPDKKKLEEAKIQLKIGDKVNLAKNCSGVVK
ncbi:hypothetical protein RFI_38508, partial [Reticulomyxa filosa]